MVTVWAWGSAVPEKVVAIPQQQLASPARNSGNQKGSDRVSGRCHVSLSVSTRSDWNDPSREVGGEP